MKTDVRSLVCGLTLSTLMLWGCSGSGPAPAGESKTAPQNTQASEAKTIASAPSAVPAAPTPVVPDHPASAPKPRKAVAKPAPEPPPPPELQTPGVAAASPAPSAPAEPAPQTTPQPQPAVAPTPAPAPIFIVDTRPVTIPAGAEIAVRMIDSVDSDKNQAGETFRASLDSAVRVDNQIVLPQGGDVYLRLKQVRQAGDLRGKSDLQLELDRIFVGKKSYTVESNVYESSGESQGAKAARNAGIGAAIGAAIGAIAGGGKGAAVGAGAGAGGGVVGTVLAKGGEVRIQPETRLVFTLQKPVEVTVSAVPVSEQNFTSGPARLSPDPAPQNARPRSGFPGARRGRRP